MPACIHVHQKPRLCMQTNMPCQMQQSMRFMHLVTCIECSVAVAPLPVLNRWQAGGKLMEQRMPPAVLMAPSKKGDSAAARTASEARCMSACKKARWTS